MQIEVTHEILTNNHLRIYGDDEIIVDKPFVYIFAEDSPCALTVTARTHGAWAHAYPKIWAQIN